jgi:hypothetical protein
MKDLPQALPEKLDMDLAAEASSDSTGAKRQVWKNKQYGITLVVTWAPPYPEIGLQSFSITALPHYTFTNYEALRQAYAEKVLK